MEKNWERRHDFVAIDQEKLAALLQPAFPDKNVTAAELLTSGHCNTNYKITMSGLDEAFVLRLYVRDQDACQKDLDIFNLVHARVPVPEILYADPEGIRHDTVYAVMRWVDGVLLSEVLAARDLSAIEGCAEVVGTTLANIGAFTFPQAGFFGPGLVIAQPFDDTMTFTALIDFFLSQGYSAQWLGPALTERLRYFVNNNAHYLSQAENKASLVHSDYKGINILVGQEHGHWQVAAVLDWEFAFANSPLTDVANMLRYDHTLPPVFESAFIQGYRDHGGYLPAEWKRMAKLLDLISLCDFLNTPTRREALFEDVISLIVSTMDRWETFGP